VIANSGQLDDLQPSISKPNQLRSRAEYLTQSLGAPESEVTGDVVAISESMDVATATAPACGDDKMGEAEVPTRDGGEDVVMEDGTRAGPNVAAATALTGSSAYVISVGRVD
jgi:hypothetical protein